jgi:helicase
VNLPEDFLIAENSAAAMLRGQNRAPMSIGYMYAIAQNIMGAFQRSGALVDPQRLHEEDAALPLIAAARLLQVISRTQQHRGLDADVVRRTRLLASCAYAMAGNLPSAAAVQRDIEIGTFASGAEVATAATCNPGCIPNLLASDHLDKGARDFLEALNSFLITGEPHEGNALRSRLEQLTISSRGVFDAALLASARLVLAHVTHLSITKARGGRANLHSAISGFSA